MNARYDPPMETRSPLLRVHHLIRSQRRTLKPHEREAVTTCALRCERARARGFNVSLSPYLRQLMRIQEQGE